MVMAPLTRGGNLPFRRLCTDFGMEVSLSEMVYARHLLKGQGTELARLRRAPGETFFGVQLATNQIEEGQKAIELVQKIGADFVDLNCGCPIYEATRRGLGSALLRTPSKLERLVQGLAEECHKRDLPLSVKIRLGVNDNSINVLEVIERLTQVGASSITIHGRTAQQGYRKPADWDLLQQAAISTSIPVIGNGDVFTHYEAQRRLEESGVHAVMVGRAALIKPWIFQEFKQGREMELTLEERISIYRRLVTYMKDYFGDDELVRAFGISDECLDYWVVHFISFYVIYDLLLLTLQ